MIKKQNALILFTKNPVPGSCKKRLTPELTPGQAAALYQAFLLDLIDKFRNHPRYDFLVYLLEEGSGPGDFWKDIGIDLRTQSGGNLGERMYHAFRDGMNRHYKKIVLMGSDIPSMTVNRVMEAFDRLETSDVVLGPAHDGGYYLIGLTRADRKVFTDMPWGTDRVFEQTLDRIRKLNRTCAVLEKEHDIDDAQDLRRLLKALRGESGHTFRQQAPRTFACLRKLTRFKRMLA